MSLSERAQVHQVQAAIIASESQPATTGIDGEIADVLAGLPRCDLAASRPVPKPH